jgi:hypothetical protein
MKSAIKLLVGCCALSICLRAVAASAPAETNTNEVRQELVQAILSTGADQQKALTELSETGSRTANEVLSAWTLGEVYIYVAPDGSKAPVMLEDQQDADGKARAIRVMDGQFVQGASGKELRFGDSDLNSADTDVGLRSQIRQTLDTLALADPDPDARYSAVTKLGNSQKESAIPILQRQTRHPWSHRLPAIKRLGPGGANGCRPAVGRTAVDWQPG